MNMDLIEKQFIMFKFFLSMNGIYLNNDLENNIKKAFELSHNNNIDYSIMNDVYFNEILNKTISDSKKLNKLSVCDK